MDLLQVMATDGSGNLNFGTNVEVDKLTLIDHGGNSQMWTIEEDSASPATNAITFDYAGVERVRIAPTGLITSIGGAVFGDVVRLPTFTVGTAPTPTAGAIAFFSDGAAGSPVLAFGDGANWLRSDTLVAISV